MKRWSDLAAEDPVLAEAGRALFHQYGPGLGYLATIRKDGGPRVHPVCPVIARGGLYVFIGNHSPKLHDLLRDGRFALHSFPKQDVDDEFCVRGRAKRVDDASVRAVVRSLYGNRRVHERRHAVRAVPRERSLSEMRAAAELAARLHEVARLLTDANARITGAA